MTDKSSPIEKYNPQEIEPRWQQQWQLDNLYRSTVDPSRPKHYALTMLPYPSGDLHIGHWYAMTPSDARARYMRMKGYNVLFPMGFDAFGLPAENAAIKRHIHPSKWTYTNIDRMRGQLRSMGTMFDWEREAVSCTPEYYRWTQWFFLQLFKNGLAYKQRAAVDFCPNCNTTLAREQVWGDDRHCERCGTPVVKKNLDQWFFRITKYADELADHSQIDWPDQVKLMQNNWVGRSEGAHVTFKTERGDDLLIFTTRPDTLWGATFMVLAPEHPLVAEITTDAQRAAVEAYRTAAEKQTEIERTTTDRPKTGVFTGAYAINPVNQERIQIWIADYVLMGYGTGAIMAVPGGDQRDFQFARAFNLPVRVVVQPEGASLDGATMDEPYAGSGVMVNSGLFDGTPGGKDSEGIAKVIAWIEAQGFGRGAVTYKLRDWLISRQRYWGAPIPMIFCDTCGVVPVPEDQLPVMLPEDVEFNDRGENPLKTHPAYMHVACPQCGGDAHRETDTMDTFMCSSWYQLRYLSPHYDKAPFDPAEAAYWLPVDQYTGGIEHATMHLMYTRFFTMALNDCGVFDDANKLRPADKPIGREPMRALRNQGMILGEPRAGHFVIVDGEWENDQKLNAQHIRVIAESEAEAAAATNPNAVVGEIQKRVETLLNVHTSGDRDVTVEVFDGVTTYDIPGIGVGAGLNDLRYHLDVEKMSKSKGNVVDPDDLVARYGADVVRGYLMFAFRWNEGGPWDSKGIQGVVRWLNDVWNLVTDTPANTGMPNPDDVRTLRRFEHLAIKEITDGLETFQFNTPVAGLMKLKNAMVDLRKTAVVNDPAWGSAIQTMLKLMAPITPHIAEELWARVGGTGSIHTQSWPMFDAEAIKMDKIELVVQFNGKIRAKIMVDAGISEEDSKAEAVNNSEIKRLLNGAEPKRVVYVTGRSMVNIVG
jgi:leucyl-tRNA synthetase